MESGFIFLVPNEPEQPDSFLNLLDVPDGNQTAKLSFTIYMIIFENSLDNLLDL